MTRQSDHVVLWKRGRALSCLCTLATLSAHTSSLAGPSTVFVFNDSSSRTLISADLVTLQTTTLGTGRTFAAETLAVDDRNGWVYWTGFTSGGDQNAINRSRLDGSAFATIVSPFPPVQRRYGMQANPADGRIYWNDYTHIYRANADGSGVQTFLTLPSGSTIQDLAIDWQNGYMYISDFVYPQPGRLERIGLDGNGLTTLVSGIASGPVALTLDVSRNRLLFATNDLQNSRVGSIFSAGLDGADIQSIASGVYTIDLGVDPQTGEVIWTQEIPGGARSIWRAGSNGSNPTVLNLGLTRPFSLAVIPEPSTAASFAPLFFVLIALRARRTETLCRRQTRPRAGDRAAAGAFGGAGAGAAGRGYQLNRARCARPR